MAGTTLRLPPPHSPLSLTLPHNEDSIASRYSIFRNLPSTWLVNKLLLEFHYSVYKSMAVDLFLSQFSSMPRLQTQFSITSTTLIQSSHTLYLNSIFRFQKQSHFASFTFLSLYMPVPDLSSSFNCYIKMINYKSFLI